MNKNEYLVVMTACIDPGSGHYPLTRSDPGVRLEDYKSALRFWLNYPDERIRRILFIENSNYPLDALERIVVDENPGRKDVEFVSLDCNWYPPGGHYGYAELRMLELGLERSTLPKSTTHMIKVSGRFSFPDLTRLLDRLPGDFDAVADTRAWQSFTRRHARPYVTTQLILFKHEFYRQHLQDCYKDLEQGTDTHMEGIYYSKLAALKDTHQIRFRFPVNVDPVGVPAHRGRSYQHPSQKVRSAIRGMIRRLFPNWWL